MAWRGQSHHDGAGGQTGLRLAGLCVIAALCAACGNDVMDGQCTPDSPDITLDEDCPYQNGRGPQVTETACPPITGECGGSDWADVFSILTDQSVSGGNCSNSGCHGVEETAALGIFLPANDQIMFYETLLKTKGSIGRPYVDQNSPRTSWMACNVLGTRGGGFPMPKPSGLPNLADADTVIDWLRCEAPGP